MLKGPILEYRQGGGGCAWIGFIISFIGFFFLSSTLSLFGPVTGEPMAIFVARVIGGLLGLLGLLLALGRSAIELDRQKERVLSWKGLLFPIVQKSYDFSAFRSVSIKLRIVEGSDSFELFEVHLLGKNDEDSFEVESFHEYAQARVEAEKMARFLQVPVEDKSRGELDMTPFEELNLLLAERTELKKKEEPQSLPALIEELPALLQVTSRDGRQAEVVVKPLGFTPEIIVVTLISTIIFVAIFWNIFLPFFYLMGPETKTPPYVRYFFTPFMMLFMCGPLSTIGEGVLRAFTKENIRIEKGCLIVEQISPLKTKEEKMDLGDIKDIVVNESKTSAGQGRVIVIGEGEVLSLGERLPTLERQTLKELLSRLIIDGQR